MALGLEHFGENLADDEFVFDQTIFGAFDDWFHEEPFEGCLFINTLTEADHQTTAIREAALAALAEIRALIAEIAAAAGVRDPNDFAQRLQIIMSGSITNALQSDADAAKHAQSLAKPLLDSLLAVHRLTKAQARRIAVQAQLLDAARPNELLEVVQRLTLLQIDPTAAIAPSADLVAWSRLGSSYRPADLKQALEQDRTLFELDALVRPMSDLGLYLAGAADRPSYARTRAWLRDNDRFRRDILDLLEASGPLSSRDIPDTCVVPWASSGWTNNRNVTQMLEVLMMRGEVAIAGRVGRERLWDLPERVYPSDLAVPTVAEAERKRNERRLASLGIARQKARAMPMEPVHVGEAGEPAVVEGVKGEWRVDPDALGDGFEGRTALLSPFDRLVHDRVRTLELFDFEYTLEMYKPAAKRRWGYFALPILHEDRLVGKVDAAADRKASVLRVHTAHEDVEFTRAMTKAVQTDLADLASWLELGGVEPAA